MLCRILREGSALPIVLIRVEALILVALYPILLSECIITVLKIISTCSQVGLNVRPLSPTKEARLDDLP